MVRLALCGLTVVAVGTSIGVADEKPPARPVTKAHAVIAVYRDGHCLAALGNPVLIVAVWPDGRVVWSADRMQGGSPYRAGRIEPSKVTELLNRLDKDGLFDDKKLTQPRFGPDSTYHTLLVKSGKKQLKMQSWHELSESGGGVCTDGGLRATDRKRLDVLRAGQAEWLYYRMVWAETKGKLSDLLPTESKPTAGEMVNVGPGEWAWQESAPAK